FFNTATRLLAAAGMRVYAAASRAAQAIFSSITRFLSAAKRVLVRVGGFIYRGIVFLGVQLLRFVVVLYAAVIILGISTLGFSMLNVAGVYDPAFVIFVMFLSFFVLFSPSLLFRERHKSPLMQVCIVGLGVAFGGFVFSLDSALHLGIRVPLAIAASLLIFTAGRAWLPERMKLGLPIAAWVSILTAGSFYTYITFLALSQVNAILISLLIFGIGLLPLRIVETLRQACGGAYLILATPSGTLLVFIFTLNLYISLSIFALLPTVVLYRQYATGMRMIAAGFAKIGRLIVRELTLLGKLTAMYLAIYIVAASAILSVSLGILFLQFSMPFMQTLLYSDILTILVFILVVMVLWLPFVGIRRIDYQSLFSTVLVIAVLVSGSIAFLFTLPHGLFRAALFTISLTTLFGAMVIPGIHRVQSRFYPIVVSIAAFMVLSLDLLALDMVTNIGVASFCLALLAAPFISGVTRVRIVYPITTTAFLGTLFYHMVLPVTDIWLSLSAFIAIETLLLMLPSETRSWQAWWAFSISIGYTTYALLAAFPALRIISAIFLAIELVRLTPDIEYRFSEYYEVLNVSRAAILSFMAWLLFSPYLIFELAVEISIVLFFIVTTASLWKVSSPRVRTGLVDLLAISLTLLAITQFLFVLQLDFLFSVYMASVPLLASFAYGSKTGVGRRAHWILLRGMVTVLIGFVWYGAYQSVESLILSSVTGLVAALAITLQAPWGIENKRSLTSALNGSIILLLQTLWIWHAILMFGLPANVILVGCSILLGSVVLFPATGSISWYQFEGLWELVSFTVALTVGSALAGWDITQGTLPSNLILVAGWCLTCYSLVSVPMTLYGEKSQGMQKSEKVAQMAWVPAVFGLTLLGYAFSFSAGYDMMYQLFTAGMAFSISFIVFAVLHPSPSSRLKVIVNMSFSLCMALLAFITFGWIDPVWSLGLPLMVWYLFSLPVLMHPTYLVLARTYTIVLAALTKVYTSVVTGLTRIYSGIVAGLSRIYNVILANSDNIAFGFPVIIGVWFGATFFLNETCPTILGFDLRNFFQGVAVAAMAMGGLYFVEAWTMNGNVSQRVKGPSVALLGRGLFVLLLSIYLPEIAADLNLILYFVLGALSVSFFAVFTLNLVFGL
ncbi:MAG: hypothetical protein KAQ65_05435, partial [Candidatus Thorarchaeota archaeon]|nr:hypothetical protein [Candidatus Thorarchaeota archaeon]